MVIPILATAASIATAIGFNLTCIQLNTIFKEKWRNCPHASVSGHAWGWRQWGHFMPKNGYFIYKLKSLASLNM